MVNTKPNMEVDNHSHHIADYIVNTRPYVEVDNHSHCTANYMVSTRPYVEVINHTVTVQQITWLSLIHI